MHTVTEIEDAILTTLQEGCKIAGYVKTFTHIPSLDQATLERIFRLMPAIGVISDEGVYDYSIGSRQQETGSFAILCFNKNMRSPAASSHGITAREHGVWDMIEDCRRIILPGALTGVTIIDCIARRRKLLYAGEKGAAAALEVEVKWRNL